MISKYNINSVGFIILLLILSVCITQYAVFSKVLPEDRACQWSGAGLIHKMNPGASYNILEYGADNTGFEANDDILYNLIQNFDENGGDIYFPPGEYLFKNSIILKSNICLSGYSSEETVLIFELEAPDDLIKISGRILLNKYNIIDDLAAGDSVIPFESLPELGETIIKLFDDDSELIYSEWALGAGGQIVIPDRTLENSIVIKGYLRRDYLLQNAPYARIIEPVNNVSVSRFKIINGTQTENQTSNILLNNALNCEVKCIESENCNFAHIDIRNSSHILVHNSFIHNGFSYGGGGRAYGAVLHSTSGDCLVENNIFRSLRHSILLQSGANGNVVAYNYSCKPYWSEVSLPENSSGDLVLHGNYPYLNLFEGNIAQNIVIDDSHGKNGPYNTFFRNRAEFYGIFMNFNPASDSQNFIGNEITNGGMLLGLYFLNGDGHFEYANNVKGTINPDGTSSLPDSSYYMKEAPTEYSVFPFIGPPNDINKYENMAKKSYDDSIFVSCPAEVSVNKVEAPNIDNEIIIISYDNAIDLIRQKKVEEFILTDICGRNYKINYPYCSFLPAGIYFACEVKIDSLYQIRKYIIIKK